jgi:phosphoribosylanthranilate isomerase
MVRIKMCGITKPSDAAAAANAGASSIGIIAFENSPRYVPPTGLTEIRNALPPWVSITIVAPDAEIAARYDADFWQLYLHPDRIPNKPIIQAIRVDSDLDVTNVLSDYGVASALLFDAYHPNLMGGSGHRISDSVAARLFAGECQVPRILAGGLTPDNVADAISTFSPWGVDVSSGIELSPGIKCASKMKAFAAAVLKANAS